MKMGPNFVEVQMNSQWRLAKLDPNEVTERPRLGLYDETGALRFFSAGGQWFFSVGEGRPAFYADGTNLYWADGRSLLVEFDRSLLQPTSNLKDSL